MKMKEKTKTNIIIAVPVICIIIFGVIIGEKTEKNQEKVLSIKRELCNENGLEFDEYKQVCFNTTNGFVRIYEIIYINGSSRIMR